MSSEDRIAALEAKIDELQKSQDEVSQQLAKAQREQWQGRIDELELQARLGAMEADDRVQARMEHLRTTWDEARHQFGEATSTAGDVKDTVWTGLSNAAREVRDALMESKKKISGSDSPQ